MLVLSSYFPTGQVQFDVVLSPLQLSQELELEQVKHLNKHANILIY